MKTTTWPAAACALLLGLACGGGGGGGGGDSVSVLVAAATGGTVALDGGPSLAIPAGALAADTTITLRRSGSAPPAGALTALYAFGPAGTAFSSPAQVTFPLPAGTSAGLVRWTVPGSTAGYQALPTAVGGGAATAAVGHLSNGFVGPAAYVLADLQGAWRASSIASAPGLAWWERAQATIAAGGALSGTSVDSEGETGAPSGTLSIADDGLVTLASSPDPVGGYLDASGSVMVWADTWTGGTPGATELKFFQKMAATYASEDLVGELGMVSLASGPDGPWWFRIRGARDLDGAFSGAWEDSDGATGTSDLTMAVGGSGAVTLTGPGVSGTLYLGAGKTTLAGVKSWEGGTAELELGVALAASYAPADLAGTWAMTGLASGALAPWWMQALLTVEADGSFSGPAAWDDGATGTESGTFVLGADGTVTRSGAGWESLAGFLDATGNVVVGTSTVTGDEGVSAVVFTLLRVR